MNLIKSHKIFLINPNLGHPKIIGLDKKNPQKKNRMDLLFISNIQTPQKLEEYLTDKIKLVPLFEYKWKLKKIIKERSIWKKIKNLGRKIRNLFSSKKREVYYKVSIEELDKYGMATTRTTKLKRKEIARIKPRAFRAEQIIPKILTIKPTNSIKIDEEDYINNQYTKPQYYLERLEVFNDLNNFYIVEIEFNLHEGILEFLSDKNFIMFDILYAESNSDIKVNYHSLVISKNDWKNINVVQVTDLHIAQRNDDMYDTLDAMHKKVRKKNVKKTEQINKNELNKKDKKNYEKSLSKIDLSFRRRLINPNNMFRKFIREVNKGIVKNEIDFIFITGDIVDFTQISTESNYQDSDNSYEKSNWRVFKNILLNIEPPNRKGIRKTNELLCPIFTIPGNHDYRPWQYDLNWGGIYKKMGLKKEEASLLGQSYSASPIKAILKSDRALKGYFSEINPSLDYYIMLGDIIFIFLDSGSDSYKKMVDFISGSPSLTGLSERQMRFLKNVVEYKFKKKNQIILSLHAPPINTRQKRNWTRRLKDIFKKRFNSDISEYKETNYRNSENNNKARIDDKFNVTYGTLTHNLRDFLHFCSNYCTLVISGHTHALKEYRMQKLKTVSNSNENINEINYDCAIFYDDFSELYRTSNKIQQYKTFIVQTPSLGLKSSKKFNKIGAYREIIIKSGKLSSFQVKYI